MNSRDQHIVKLIYRRILEKDPTAEVILYGSRARGTQTRESDWDLLILLKNIAVDKKTEQSFRHHLFDLE
jgi:predicted nucleotidyltransferase